MLKKLLRNLDLNIKINFLIVSVTALILIALGITIYFTQSVILKNNIDSQIGFYIHNFDYLLQKKSQENSVNSKLVADYIFQINEESGKTMLFSKDTLSIYIRERVSLKEEELIVELDKYCNITNLESKGLMLSVLYKSGMRRGCNGQNVESIAETKIFSKIKYINDNTIHTVYYQWPENQNAEKHIMYLKYFSNYNAFLVISAPENFLFKSLYQLRNIIIISILISIVLLIIILNFIIRPLSANLHEIAGVVTEMSKGKDVGIIDIDSNDEIGKISTSINSLIIGTKELNNFSNELKTGNYNSVFKPLSEQDLLGNSLLEMRESLKKAELEREMQAISEEQRNWANMGLANFADILRKNDSNISDLSFYVISELVKYVDAVMGGIFILNDEDNNNIYLELTGCFAYDRRKYLVRKLIPGEGLVGSCFLEKQNIYLTDIPEGYLEIVSGLGDTNPKVLLLTPMILNEKVFGVIEIASFKKFDQYKIDFIKKLGEIIASTISNVKNNMRTTTLLEQSKIQSEEMREQEEELRQNMEELQATQEEAARREHEMHETLNAINNSIAMVEIDMDGYVMDANPLFISLTSSTLLQIQNKSLASIVSKDFDIDELIAELNDGRSFTGYIPFNSNSSEVKLRVTFTPLKNEDEMYYKTIGILTREVE